MNLEQFIEHSRTSGGGRHNSAGQFSLTLPRLLDKIAQHALETPWLGPLALISAGVGSGARSISVIEKKGCTTYRFDVDSPSLASFEDLWQSPTGQRFLWALGVQRDQVPRLELYGAGQPKALIFDRDGCTFEVDSEERLLTEVRVHGGPPAAPLLYRHCALCPVPLTLDGSLIQMPLDRAHRGKDCRWSSTVPLPLKPEAPPLLKTQRSVFLARTAAPKPVWSAVVGGIAYPFTLPIEGIEGVVWSEQLKVDLGLQKVVGDQAWQDLRKDLLLVRWQ